MNGGKYPLAKPRRVVGHSLGACASSRLRQLIVDHPQLTRTQQSCLDEELLRIPRIGPGVASYKLTQ